MLNHFTSDQLKSVLGNCLNLYEVPEQEFSDLDLSLFQSVINSITRDEEGRLVAPALWDSDVEHLLSRNLNLARNILKSTFCKLQKNRDALSQYDQVIQDQLCEGIICEVEDLDSFLKSYPDASFLPHSGVVREDSQTTKLRVVFLSNLAEKRNGGMSHNAVSHPGPNLNYPLMFSLTLLRFSKFLLTFDLRKAFLQIKLRESDSRKLLFLWGRDVLRGDFTPVCYRFLRLGFGLRFSPSILLSCLWYILMREEPSDHEQMRRIKSTFYSLAYMDNISYTSSCPREVESAYENSFEIFGEYKFDLQKFYTNKIDLQARIDATLKGGSPQVVDLLGLKWDRIADCFVCSKLSLDSHANTKRNILSSVNSVFDLCGICLPLMNRAKFFLHKLQVQQDLDWDEPLSSESMKEWQCICKQLNDSQDFQITRSFGDRSSEFKLVACADASKEALGCCFYLWDLKTDSCTFLAGKSRIVGKDLRNKSIPVLELVALTWAIELCMELYSFFVNTLQPVKILDIIVFCDSSISLCWVKAKANKVGKVERKAVLVNNKLNKIMEVVKTHPVRLRHLAGRQNPADAATRPVSSALLKKSNYHSGPSLEVLKDEAEDILVPSPYVESFSVYCVQTRLHPVSSVIQIEDYSSFFYLAKVMNFVYKFIKNCRRKVFQRDQARYNHFNKPVCTYVQGQNYLVRVAQQQSFPKVLDFFYGKLCKCEPIVTQLNLYLDNHGIIRVKSKFRRLESDTLSRAPILLSRSCRFTRLIIEDLHKRMRCAQTFKLLASLRQEFYVPKAYSVIKNVIKNCVNCRLLHGRSVAVNVNDYPDFRINPGRRPFTTVMIDTIGPFNVNVGNCQHKHYLLLLTCMFTRAINLVICESLGTADFLRAVQLHILEYGVMESIVSDNQPSFVVGLDYLGKVLKETDFQNFLKSHGIKSFSFKPYPSGASFLGGAVESLVKQVKHVLYVSISRGKVTSKEFSYLVAEAKALVNKRVIGFKKCLTNDQEGMQVPFAITPESLLKGYEVPSFNILSLGEENDTSDRTWEPTPSGIDDLYNHFKSLNTLRSSIQELYEIEFLGNLEWQAVNSPNRYKLHTQRKLQIDDLVAVKCKFLKPFFYPRGIVTGIEYNDVEDINAVTIRKANGEKIRRHPSDIVLLLPSCKKNVENATVNAFQPLGESRPFRRAKEKCMETNRNLAREGAV